MSEEQVKKAIEILCADIPCCGCCQSDDSYKERAVEVAAALGFKVEWVDRKHKNGGFYEIGEIVGVLP